MTVTGGTMGHSDGCECSVVITTSGDTVGLSGGMPLITTSSETIEQSVELLLIIDAFVWARSI